MDGEIQAKSELRKQLYTVTLFDCNHLAHVIVLSQMQALMCYRTVFASFYFKFEGNFQVQAPGGLYLEGPFNGGFLTFGVRGGGGLIFGGAYTWKRLFSEFYGNYKLFAQLYFYIFIAIAFLVIVGFHMTSLKVKLRNYRSY